MENKKKYIKIKHLTCVAFPLQYFKENPDYNNPAYNTKYGIYSERCGLNNVMMSWGHDDYMYLVSPWKILVIFLFIYVELFNAIIS